MKLKVTGIVIDSNPYDESAKMVNILTPDGFFSLLAKGVRKKESKNRVLILDCSLNELDYIQKNERNILTNGRNIISSDYLLSSYYGVIFMNFTKEVIYKVVLKEEAKELYAVLKEALEYIRKSDADKNVILISMVRLFDKALLVAGYDPLEYIKKETNKSNDESLSIIEDIRNNTFFGKITELNYSKLLEFLNSILFKFNNIKINSIEML